MKLSKNQAMALGVLIKDKISESKLYSNSIPYKGKSHLMTELKWNKARVGGVVDHMKRNELVVVDSRNEMVTPTFLGVAAYLSYIKDSKPSKNSSFKYNKVKKVKIKNNTANGLTKKQEQALRVLCKYENYEAQVNHSKTYKGVDHLIEELDWGSNQAHGVVSSLVRNGLATSINRNEFVTPTYQGIVKLFKCNKENKEVVPVKTTDFTKQTNYNDCIKSVIEAVEGSGYNKGLITRLEDCVVEWQESNIKVKVIQESWSDDTGMYLKGVKEVTLGNCFSMIKGLGESIGTYDPDSNSFFVNDGISIVIPKDINPVLVLSLAIGRGV